MSKDLKDDDFGLDDLSDDLDFGLDDTDPPSGNTTGKKRKPVLDGVKAAGKGALNGVLPKSKQEELILSALPKSATPAYSGYKDLKGALDDIASHTKEEVGVTMRQLKRNTRQMLPTMRKYLPESITKKIETFSKDDEWQGGPAYDPNEAKISGAMQDIFGSQDQPPAGAVPLADKAEAQADQKEAQEQYTEQNIRNTVKDMKDNSLLSTAITISRSVQYLANSHRNITVNYQRKSLELQFRNLFALQAIATQLQTDSERTVPAIEAIQKNTALPDYAKEQFSEVQTAMLKRKVAEFISPAKYTEGFINNVRDKMIKRVSDVLSEGRGYMDMIAGASDSSMDLELEGEGQPLTPDQQKDDMRNKAIEWGSGKVAAKYLNPYRDKGAAWLRDNLERNPQAAKMFDQLQYNFQNIGTMANSAMADERGGVIGGIFKTLHSLGLADSFNREGIKLEERNKERLDEAQKWDRRSWITLNEIIPAWFSRLNQSVRAIIGESVDETYDMSSRTFVSNDKVAGRIRKVVSNDDQRKRMRENLSATVDKLDTKGELNEDSRKALESFLESRISEAKEFNIDQLLKDDSALRRHGSYDQVESILNVLRGANGGDTIKASNEVSGRLNSMRNSISSYQQRVDEMIGIYGEKALVDSGVFKYDAENDRLIPKENINNFLYDNDKLEEERKDPRKAAENAARKATSLGRGDYRPNRKTRVTQAPSDDSNMWDKFKDAMHSVLREERKSSESDRLKAEVSNNRSTAPKAKSKPIREDSALSKHLEDYAKAQRDYLADVVKHLKHMDEEGIVILGGQVDANTGEPIFQPTDGQRKRFSLLRKGFGASWKTGKWGFGKGIKLGGWGTGKVLGGLDALRERAKNNNAADKLTSLFGGGLGIAGNGIKAIKRGLDSTLKAAVGARDLYNEKGERILEGIKLKAGDYFKKDKDGNLIPIKTLEDLKGAFEIFNRDGQVVVDKDTLGAPDKLTYYVGKKWWKLTEILGNAAGTGINLVAQIPQWLSGRIGNPPKAALKWALAEPDVYVNGKLRLRSDALQKGEYRVDGKPIYKTAEITGEVTDLNGKVIISKEELESPEFLLTDREGKPIKSRLAKFYGKAQDRVKKAAEFALSLPGRIKNKFKFGKFAPDLKISGGGVALFQNKTNTILANIYRLLNKRMEGDPEDEGWLDELDLEGKKASAAASKIKSTIKEKYQKAKEKAKSKFDKKAEQAKTTAEDLKAKGSKAAQKARTKANDEYKREILGERPDNDAIAQRLAENKGATSQWYKEKAGAKLQERRSDSLRAKAEKAKQDIVQNVDDVRAARKASRDRLAEAGKSLSNRQGTRHYFRDKIANEIANRRDTKAGRTVKSGLRGLRGLLANKPVSAASNRVKGFFTANKANNDNTDGKANKPSVMDRLLAKMSEMNQATQGMWYNTMRNTAEANGANDAQMGVLGRAFSRGTKFAKNSASGIWMRLTGRRKEDEKPPEPKDKKKPFFKRKGKRKGKLSLGGAVDLLLAGIGGMVGGLPGMIAGAMARTVVPMIAKFALKGAGRLALSAAGTIGSVALSAGSAILSGAAAVGSAVVGAVGLPVIAAVAAVAVVGWAAYKILTTKKAEYLDKMRLAQYGVQDYDEWSSDEAAKVRYLEDKLRDYVTFDNKGVATLRGLNAKEATKMGEGYGIDAKNTTELLAFHKYLQERFIPIYLKWLAECHVLESAPKLADIGDKSKVSKKEMLKAHKDLYLTKDSPYLTERADARKADRGWFKSATDWVGITDQNLLSADDVVEVEDEVLDEIKRLPDPKDSAKEHSLDNTVMANFKQLDQNKANALKSFKKDKDGNWVQTDDAVDGANIPTDTVFGGNKVGTEKAKKSTIDALVSLRYKTYGVTEIKQSVVATLSRLEQDTLKHINLTTGEFKGDMDSLLVLIGGSGDGEKVGDVRYWFRHRFLPVLTTYALAMKRFLPNANVLEPTLTGEYLYQIGKLIVGCKTQLTGQDTSVWFVRVGPFNPMNDDPSSVTEELKTLQKLSKDKTVVTDLLPDETKSKSIKLDKDRYAKKSKQVMDDIQKRMAADNKREDSVYGSNANEAATTNASKSALTRADGSSSLDTLNHNAVALGDGNATGGDYDELSKHLKKTSDIINAASKVVGVDARTMLTIAQTESGLNPNAKAGTSSAAGLYQFTRGTWKEMMKKYANDYGIPASASPTDPVAASLLGGAFLRENAEAIQGVLGRTPSLVDYYVPHFLGIGGAKSFYRALNKDSSTIAAKVLPAAAKANKPIFYNRDGSPRSVGEVYKYLTSKMSSNESYVADKVQGATGVASMATARRRKAVERAATNDAKSAVAEASQVESPIASIVPKEQKAPTKHYNNTALMRRLKAKAAKFKADHAAANDADHEVYSNAAAKAATQVAPKAPVQQSHPQLDQTNDWLKKSYEVHNSSYGELVSIRKMLKEVLLDKSNGASERNKVEQMQPKTQHQPLQADHTQSMVSVRRVVDV